MTVTYSHIHESQREGNKVCCAVGGDDVKRKRKMGGPRGKMGGALGEVHLGDIGFQKMHLHGVNRDSLTTHYLNRDCHILTVTKVTPAKRGDHVLHPNQTKCKQTGARNARSPFLKREMRL